MKEGNGLQLAEDLLSRMSVDLVNEVQFVLVVYALAERPTYETGVAGNQNPHARTPRITWNFQSSGTC